MKLIYSLVFLLLFSGCSMIYSPTKEAMIENKNAVDYLVKKTPLSSDDKVIVTTFYDINQLNSSSDFGRTLTENLIKNLVDRKIKVYEVKLRDALYVKKKEGEFIISRDIHKISQKYNIDYFIVGTYSIKKDIIYINLKVINPSNNIIVASYDYTVDKYRPF